MTEVVRFRGSLFGYTALLREGDTFVALTGDGEQDLRVGMRVRLLGDSRGYVPGGFSAGDEAVIVRFVEPFTNGESDHIIKVNNDVREGRVKPSNIQRNIAAVTGVTAWDSLHIQLKERVHAAVRDFLDAAYLALPEEERRSLPHDIGPYVDRLVSHALGSLERLGEPLAEAIARLHAESPTGERFLKDPVRSTSISRSILFLDSEGELISVKNPEIVWDVSRPSAMVLSRYASYEVLTGSSRGKRVPWTEGALGTPSYRTGVVSRIEAARNREPTPHVPDSEVILLIHGIRTAATWAEMVARELRAEPRRKVIPIRYGYFDTIRFLLPLGTRTQPVRRVLQEMRAVREQEREARVSVVAHSFGTFALSRILLTDPIRLHHVVMCGAIVPTSFRWDLVKPRITGHVVNDCGARDVWPILAASTTWGYGPSGTLGTGSTAVRDRFHDLPHSGFFTQEFVRRYWRPIFEGGEIVGSEWEAVRPRPPYWHQMLVLLPIRWMALGGFIVALWLVAQWAARG